MRRMWSAGQTGSATVLTFAGFEAVCDSCDACCARWAAEVADLCRPLSAGVVVFDLTRATFMPAGLLNGILAARRGLAGRGTECRACAPPAVRELLSATRLDRIIRVYPDRSAALAGE